MKLLIGAMDQNLTTKTDLREFEFKMDSRFKDLESTMDSKFSKFDSKFQELEYKLTIKLGTMLTVAIGATATLIKLL